MKDALVFDKESLIPVGTIFTLFRAQARPDARIGKRPTCFENRSRELEKPHVAPSDAKEADARNNTTFQVPDYS
jgi:hypothetical protein